MKAFATITRRMILGLVLAAAAIGGVTGCDEGGSGGYGYDAGGYGPIDDGVFQTAADNWSDYLRS